jgi:hypothetical protein
VRLSRGRWAVLVMLGAMVAGIGAASYACASLATLDLSTETGEPGVVVTVTGAAFTPPRRTGNVPTPVVLHWEGKEGAVLAQAEPDRFGSISATFTVPEVKPGTYVILAVQETPRPVPGAPPEQPPALFAEPGTPARASFEVLAPGARATVRTPAAEPADVNGGQAQLDSTVWFVLTAAFGAVAMSLFGGGLIAFIHQSRKAKEPAAARWIPPGW